MVSDAAVRARVEELARRFHALRFLPLPGVPALLDHCLLAIQREEHEKALAHRRMLNGG